MVDPPRGKGQEWSRGPQLAAQWIAHQHGPAGLLCSLPSASPRGPSGTVHARPACFLLPPGQVDTGGVQTPGVLLAADEKSGGRSGVQTDPGLQLCSGACVCLWVSSQCVFTPHLPEEGPLRKTVYLPTCRVFAKTTILKDVPPPASGLGRGAAFPVGAPATLPATGRSAASTPGRLCFTSPQPDFEKSLVSLGCVPQWPFAMCLLRNSSLFV